MSIYLLNFLYQEEYDEDPPLNDNVIGTNQCLCLPKAELNIKNSTKRQLCCCFVVLVFNSIY